jgi:DCN1-like protein 1/2
LKKHNYTLDAAVDDYFNKTGGSLAQTGSSKELDTSFDKYKQIGISEGGDAKKDAIQGDGLMQFFQDIGIDPEQVDALIIVWKLGCEEAYTITREEWKELADLQCQNLQQVKSKVSQWKKELDDPENFKNFYYYVFDYAKEKNARSIPVDISVPYFKLVLNGRYKYLNEWCEYVEKVNKKAVTKDTWHQFLDFTRNVKSDLSDYDVDHAWPVVIDEFGKLIDFNFI